MERGFSKVIVVGAVLAMFPMPHALLAQGYDWRDTAALEHSDRKNRLLRIAGARNELSPKFYEYVIAASDLPQLGADVPVMRVVFEGKVFFNTDEYVLTEEALRVVGYISDNLKKDAPDLALFVAGHTDSRASDAYNYVLSNKRAEAFGEALRAKGAGFANIWTVGFGESLPIRPNNSQANMAANRRVEFLFASKPEAIAVWLSRQVQLICSERNDLNRSACLERLRNNEIFVAVPATDQKLVVGSANSKKAVGISDEELGIKARENILENTQSESSNKTVKNENSVRVASKDRSRVVDVDERILAQHKNNVAEKAKISEELAAVVISPDRKIFINMGEEKITVGAPEL